jgi:hypothetical protein
MQKKKKTLFCASLFIYCTTKQAVALHFEEFLIERE